MPIESISMTSFRNHTETTMVFGPGINIIWGENGSGKTSVAAILGQIYRSMGILSEKGTFTMAKREDFMVGYGHSMMDEGGA